MQKAVLRANRTAIRARIRSTALNMDATLRATAVLDPEEIIGSIQMGNITVNPEGIHGVYTEEDKVCTVRKETDGSVVYKCTEKDQVQGQICQTSDLGNGISAQTCYTRNEVTEQRVYNGVDNNTIWQVQSSSQYSRPVTLSQDEIRLLNGNTNGISVLPNSKNGLHNGTVRTNSVNERKRVNSDSVVRNSDSVVLRNGVRLEPLNNGGIGIRFD